jgi:hypothetical protein
MKYGNPDPGVHVPTEKIKANSTVEVTYDGLLARSGAQEVYIHCGSSYLKDWTDIHDMKMNKNQNGTFSTIIPIQNGNTFHICFHDNASNWDNNSGSNYSFMILDS